VFLANIGVLLVLPLVLLFTPPIFLIICYFNPDEMDGACCCICFKKIDSCVGNCLLATLLIPIIFSLGLVVGVIALGLLIVPAYIYQIFRIFKIIFRRFRCCLK